MGFPQDQCVAALRAAYGDANRAVEYLFSGIPEGLNDPGPPSPAAASPAAAAPAATSPAAPAAAAAAAGGLDALRAHPQFNDLRRLVQTNPQALPAVLQQIGQQDPALLALIHTNQAAFVQMMNEPITEAQAAAPAAAPAAGGMPGMPGGVDPAQLMQMISQMPPEQQARVAEQMGMNPQQLQAVSQMMTQLPPAALAQMMGQAGGQPGGAPPPGTIRLTEEEGAAVDRLAEMGFDKHDAAQAYLACDKNEMMAANLLMENQWGSDADMGGAADAPAPAPAPAPDGDAGAPGGGNDTMDSS